MQQVHQARIIARDAPSAGNLHSRSAEPGLQMRIASRTGAAFSVTSPVVAAGTVLVLHTMAMDKRGNAPSLGQSVDHARL